MARKPLDIESSSEWFGATIIDEKPSPSSRALFFTLCAIVVLSAALFGLVDPGIQALFILSIGAIGWLWLADGWQTGALRYSLSPLQFPLLGYVLIGFLQLLPLRSPALPENTISQAVSSSLSLDAFATRLATLFAAAVLIYFAAALAFINTPKRLQSVTATIIILGFALAVFGIIQFFGGDGKVYWIRESPQAVPFGPFINRHHFGACMEMTLGLTLGLLYSGSIDRDKRALHVFAVVIMGIGLVLTSSRGAVMSLLGVIAFLTAATFLRRQSDAEGESERDGKSPMTSRLALLGGGLALVLIIFGAVFFLGGGESLLRGIGLTGGAGDASSGRLQFWQNAFRIILDYPFLGVGLDAFGVAYTRYDSTSGALRLEQAHNDYLQVLAEAGIIGLILVAAFIFLLFRRGFQVFAATRDRFRRGVAIGALAGCFGIIIHSFFDFPLRTSSNLLMFLTLAALATVQINYPKLYRKSRNRTRESE